MALLRDVVLAEWKLGRPRAVKHLSIHGIAAKGQVPRLQLVPKDQLGSIWTPFAPSVYGGNGSEPRKSIVFSIPDDVRRQVEAIEELCRDQLRETSPTIDAIWHSSLKPAAQYPASLRAKITVAGPSPCSFIDEEGNAVPEPTDWAGLPVVPIVEFRGCYLQKGAAGMLLEVTSLLIGQKREQAGQKVEFL
jgi:hypothetical protein